MDTDMAPTSQAASAAATGQPPVIRISGRTMALLGILVALAVGVAAYVVTTNSPQARLTAAFSSLVSRAPTDDIGGAEAIAADLGLVGAPADVRFTLRNLQVTQAADGSPAYAVSGSVQASRNSTVLETAAFVAACEPTGSEQPAFTCSLTSGEPLHLADLLPRVSSLEQARALVADAAAANRVFGASVALTSGTRPATGQPTPPPVVTSDPSLLTTESYVTEPGEPAVETVYSYTAGGTLVPIYSQMTAPATPEHRTVGAIDPATLIAAARVTVQQFAAARAAGDVPAAEALLVHGYGLAESGLAVSTIDPADSLSVAGDHGTYRVTNGGSTTLVSVGGTWRIDYTGQTLAVLQPTTHFHYAGPDNGLYPGQPSPVDVSFVPIVVTATTTTTFAPAISIAITPGDRMYSDYLTISDVKVNGRPTAEGTFTCPVSGHDSLTCSWPQPIAVPAAGLHSFEATVALGPGWNPTQYGSGVIAAVEPRP
jgi:hypothetical protein